MKSFVGVSRWFSQQDVWVADDCFFFNAVDRGAWGRISISISGRRINWICLLSDPGEARAHGRERHTSNAQWETGSSHEQIQRGVVRTVRRWRVQAFHGQDGGVLILKVKGRWYIWSTGTLYQLYGCTLSQVSQRFLISFIP